MQTVLTILVIMRAAFVVVLVVSLVLWVLELQLKRH
jgi:hypothetical protein